jgi:hypothetical protein
VREYARQQPATSTPSILPVLALYKLAVINEGIYARFLRARPSARADNLGRSAGSGKRALAIADASADSRLRG